MASRFSVEAVFKAIDRVTAPVSRMQSRVGKFTRSTARGLKNVNRVLNKTVLGLAKAGGAAVAFGGILAAIAFRAINKVATAADELAKRTRRIKFPIKEFQEWQFVAEQSGIGMGEFDKSLEKFTKTVGEARSGTGTLFTLLKKSNPQLLKQVTNADNAAEAFDSYMLGLRATKNQLDKTALATAAFGRTGAKFLNITEQSSDAIKALRKEQRENGVLTKEQAAAAEAYNDAVNSLQRSLGGLLQTVIIPMLPVLTKTVREWRQWIVSNKDLVKTNVVTFLTSVRDVAKKLLNIFEFLSTHGATIGKIIAGVIALSVAVKTVTLLMAAFNLVLMLNPIGLFVAAIIGGAALIISNWEPIKSFFAELWGDIVGIFNSALTQIQGVINRLLSAVSFVKDSVSSAASTALNFVGLGDDDQNNNAVGLSGNRVISPQDRIARSIEEQRNTSTSEITLRTEQGTTAEVTGGILGGGLTLQQSGVF